MSFQMHISPIFGEVIGSHDMKPDPQNLKTLRKMSLQKSKNKLQSFLGIINNLKKFFPSMTDVCESLRQLTSSETEWTWNVTYQKLFD